MLFGVLFFFFFIRGFFKPANFQQRCYIHKGEKKKKRIQTKSKSFLVYIRFSCIKILKHHFLGGIVHLSNILSSIPPLFTFFYALFLVLLFRAGSSCWAAMITGWETWGRLKGTWKMRRFCCMRFCPGIFWWGRRAFGWKISNDPGTCSCIPLEIGNCWLLQICLRLENLQLAETALRLMVLSLRLSIYWWTDAGFKWMSICRCHSAPLPCIEQCFIL